MEKNYEFFSPVVHGTYHKETDCFMFPYDENHTAYVRGRTVARVCKRLLEGYDYRTADPLVGMTRDEAAYLLANAETLIKTVEGK